MRARSRTPALLGPALACLAVLGAACGVPVDAKPRALPKGIVSGLDRPSNGKTPADATPLETETEQIFFVGPGERLVPVDREVSKPATLDKVLAALLEGPTKDEHDRRALRSAITGRTSLIDARADGAVARVNLSNSFADLGGPEQVAAFAQIVYSATAVPGISGVTFQLSGQPIEPFGDEGKLISGPAERSDFQKRFFPA